MANNNFLSTVPQVNSFNNSVMLHMSDGLDEILFSRELANKVKSITQSLQKMRLTAFASEVVSIQRKFLDQRFTVAVVGEFNKGKSTLINNFFNREILPTSVLPTTAILTGITFGREEKISIFNSKGRKMKEMPISNNSWEAITAANSNGQDSDGYSIVEVNNSWMQNYGIRMLDTPGANDLEEKRARVIERSLMCADATIITISADKILSLTEQEFIRHKILARSVPFVAIGLTHLDMIEMKERDHVLDYLFRKLRNLNLQMPVFIARNEIDMPSEKYFPLIGFDRMRAIIQSWVSSGQRQMLMGKWLATNLIRILQTAKETIQKQKTILESNGTERSRLSSELKSSLSRAHKFFCATNEEMIRRCEKCERVFSDKMEEYEETIIENLQHEVDRYSNPKDWLENEYAYRVKREIYALSFFLDNFVLQHVKKDFQWLNNQLSKQFNEVIDIEPQIIKTKENFSVDLNKDGLNFKNLKDDSKKATIMVSALTIGACFLLAGINAPAIVATMGIGTVLNIKSRELIEKEIVEQRTKVKELIAREITRILQSASSESLVRIKIIYSDIIKEALKMESRWMDNQRALISQCGQMESLGDIGHMSEHIVELNNLITQFQI